MMERSLHWPLYQSLFVDVHDASLARAYPTQSLEPEEAELAAIRAMYENTLPSGMFFDGLLQEVRKRLGVSTAIDPLSLWLMEESSALLLSVSLPETSVQAVLKPSPQGVEYCTPVEAHARGDSIKIGFDALSRQVFDRLMTPCVAIEIPQSEWVRCLRAQDPLKELARLWRAKSVRIVFSTPKLRRKFLWKVWMPRWVGASNAVKLRG